MTERVSKQLRDNDAKEWSAKGKAHGVNRMGKCVRLSICPLCQPHDAVPTYGSCRRAGCAGICCTVQWLLQVRWMGLLTADRSVVTVLSAWVWVGAESEGGGLPRIEI